MGVARPEPVDLTLHIGTDKTGTTTLQAFFREHRDLLADQGLLYPRSLGGFRHVKFGMYVTPDPNLARTQDWARRATDGLTPAQFRQRVRRRLFREMRTHQPSRLLISDEGMFSAGEGKVEGIAAFARRVCTSVTLVAYLRRQDDHLVSNYQQVVKRGETARLGDWIRIDRSRFYDYHRRLSMWQQRLAPTRMVVRPFERHQFRDGDLITDFIEATDLGVDTDLSRPQPRNESVGAEAVEFMRLLNLHQVENLGLHPWQIQNGSLVPLLAQVPGPTLSLPGADLDDFMAAYQRSNEATARVFLDRPSGVLFDRDRKQEQVTTEQHLDPTRLDFFLDLAGVPEDQHQPLRQIAEREALVSRPC